MGWFHFLWHNGQRSLVLAVLAAVGSLLLLVGAWIGATFLPSVNAYEPPVVTPLVVTTPFVVLSEKVPQGGLLHYLNSTCNTTKEPLDVAFEASWIQEDGDVMVVPGGSGTYTNGLGCHFNKASVPLPPEVSPGTWYRAGIVEFVYSGEQYSVAYRTESFKVVP